MHYIGWDLHQRFSQLAITTEKCQLLKELKIPHFPGIFQHPIVIKLFSSPTKVAVEACNGWYWVAEVHLAPPLKTKLSAEAKVKTDKIDAKILADLLRTDFLPESYLAPSLVREKRELHRHRAALVKVRTSIKNRVHGILGKHGIFFTNVTDIFGVKGRQQLEKELTNLKPVYRGELKRYLSLIDWLDKEIEKIEDEISSTVKKDKISPSAILP